MQHFSRSHYHLLAPDPFAWVDTDGIWHVVTHLSTRNAPNRFFQAFIGATPRHPVLGTYLDLILSYYQGAPNVARGIGRTEAETNKGGMWMGPRLLGKAWTVHGPDKTQFLQEMKLDPNEFPDVLSQGGKSDACDHVVADLHSKKVPFFSRVVGFSWCQG